MKKLFLLLMLSVPAILYGDSVWSKVTGIFRAKPMPLRITNAPLPIGTTGKQYSTTLAATGGKTPYRWTATNLPTGFSVSTGGTLSGFSTHVINALPTVIVTDRTGGQNSLPMALAVCNPLVVTVTFLPQGKVGQSYAAPLTASGGVASALPPTCNP